MCIFPLFTMVLPATVTADATNPHRLSLVADAPIVAITPRDGGRSLLQLPSLVYRFVVEPGCSNDWRPVALSLSVADTRLGLDRSDLDGMRSVELELTIPAEQLAPVAIEDFCTLPAAKTDTERAAARRARGVGTGRLTLPAVLSAHASLLCARDDDASMTWASRPLDVILECTAEGRDPETP